MANRSVTFNGKTITNPGVYSSIDSSMTYSKDSSGAKVIAFIGESTGGEPDTVHFFSSTASAKKTLKSGPLLKACQKAWNPVSRTKEGLSLGGADIIACIRANRASKAQKTIYAQEISDAVIGNVVESVSDETTGTITVSGDYKYDTNKTFVVEILEGGEIVENDPTVAKCSSIEDVKAALEDDEISTVILLADITDAENLTVESGEKTLDLNGHSIIAASNTEDTNWAIKAIGGTLTITGDGTVYGGDGAPNNVAVWAYDTAVVNIENGTYDVGLDADGDTNSTIYAEAGATINIYDGDFSNSGSASVGATGAKAYVLNIQNNVGSHIYCYGGTFHNQNPADGDDKDTTTGATFVADGHEVEETGDGVYTVIATVEPASIKILASDEEEHSGIQYNVYYADDSSNIIVSSEASSKEIVIADSGLSIMFTAGTYTAGDIFMIQACAASTDDSTKLYGFVSKDWGKDNNKIQVKIEDGTQSGSKRVTVYDVKSDTYEVYDNIGLAFSIMYTGDQPYAALSIITDGTGKAIKLQTMIGADRESAIVDIDVDLDKSAFSTIRNLVRHLNGYENYSVIYNSYCNYSCNVNDLDMVMNADINNQNYMVTDYMSDMKAKLDDDSSFVTIEMYNKEITKIENIDTFSLSGGSEGTTPSSWADYFEMLGRYDIMYVVPLTGDQYIISECLEHVTEMSETFGRERRAIFGMDATSSVSEAISLAQTIASDRAQLVYPGMYDLNDEGENELYPSYILAAQFAGRVAFLPDGETATHDVFRMQAIERELDQDDIATLLNAGVVTFEFKISTSAYDESYVQCVQDLTTSRDDDILKVERAVGVTADNINKTIRSKLDTLTIGRKTTIGLLTSIKNVVESVLDNKMEKEEVIVAYKDVTVESQDDQIIISYSCAPTIPNNFTFVSGHFYSEDLVLSDTEVVSSEA